MKGLFEIPGQLSCQTSDQVTAQDQYHLEFKSLPRISAWIVLAC